MPEWKKDENERGAAWEKTSSRGPYMTGSCDGQPFVMFRNVKKPGSNGPDWRILKPSPKPEADARAAARSPIPDNPDADDPFL